MRPLYVLPILLLAADATAADPVGICLTEPARVVHIDRGRLKAAVTSSLEKHAAGTSVRVTWIPTAHAQAQLPGCDAIVRLGVRGRRRRARLDFAMTIRGLDGTTLTDELGPIDFGRIDPRSFGRVWTRLFTTMKRESLTRADG